MEEKGWDKRHQEEEKAEESVSWQLNTRAGVIVQILQSHIDNKQFLCSLVTYLFSVRTLSTLKNATMKNFNSSQFFSNHLKKNCVNKWEDNKRACAHMLLTCPTSLWGSASQLKTTKVDDFLIFVLTALNMTFKRQKTGTSFPEAVSPLLWITDCTFVCRAGGTLRSSLPSVTVYCCLFKRIMNDFSVFSPSNCKQIRCICCTAFFLWIVR